MIDDIVIQNGYTYYEVFFAGFMFGVFIVCPIVTCIRLFFELFYECIIRYKDEHQKPGKTLIDIFSYLKK